MSSIEYTDDLVVAALHRLQDELPAVIANVNDAYNDDLVLAVPDAEAYSDGTSFRDRHPWVEATIGEDELQGDPATGLWPLGQAEATTVFPLVVLVWHSEEIPGPALHTKLKRYTHCVTKVLLDRDAFTGWAPTIQKVRRVWRLSETEHDEIESFAFLRFEFTMDVAI